MPPKKDGQTAFEEVQWKDSAVEGHLETLYSHKLAIAKLKDPTQKSANAAKKAFKKAFGEFVTERELPPEARIRCGPFVMEVAEMAREEVIIPAFRKSRAIGVKREDEGD